MRNGHELNIGDVETCFEQIADDGNPLVLKSGRILSPVTVAYETYGTFTGDNAVLVFHALSGSQHAAGLNAAIPEAGSRWTDECWTGWWDGFIGPGKALDTRELFIICANYIGSCYGSTGPASINPRTNRPYGSTFPQIDLSDVVDSQVRLLDRLGVQTLRAAVGGSLGGMLCLNLALRYPERVETVIPLASGLRTTMLQRIHNYEQIFAIEHDPNFNGGDYYEGRSPDKGLALARMIGHKTFVSLKTMEDRARSEVVQADEDKIYYSLSHPVESYMLHQGKKFVQRFDANSYLRIAEMWQRADLLQDAGARTFAEAFSRCREQLFLVFSVDSDVCYYPDEQQELVSEVKGGGVECRHITVHSDKGHDSFLLDPELFGPYLKHELGSNGI